MGKGVSYSQWHTWAFRSLSVNAKTLKGILEKSVIFVFATLHSMGFGKIGVEAHIEM